MRKIVGFKLSLKGRELQRRAKKTNLDLAALGLGEAETDSWLESLSKNAVPAVLFDTFPTAEDKEAALLSPLSGLAYSLILATLGPAWCEKRRLGEKEEPARAPVWPLLEEYALSECFRFASSLIEDEAAQEACELSPLSPLNDRPVLEALWLKIEGTKIGVALSEGALVPAASAACSVSWLSKAKAKTRLKP